MSAGSIDYVMPSIVTLGTRSTRREGANNPVRGLSLLASSFPSSPLLFMHAAQMRSPKICVSGRWRWHFRCFSSIRRCRPVGTEVYGHDHCGPVPEVPSLWTACSPLLRWRRLLGREYGRSPLLLSVAGGVFSESEISIQRRGCDEPQPLLPDVRIPPTNPIRWTHQATAIRSG